MDDEWVRPYTPGTGRWLVIGWEAAALAALGWTSVALFGLVSPAVELLAAALALSWLLVTWRIARMGVYTSRRGLRICGLLRTRTLVWQDVARLWLHTVSHRLGPWRIPSGNTVLLELRDGALVNTELWAQGVDFHSRPGAFRAVYHELRQRHRAAITTPA